jgi:hypothetical protein
MLASLDRQPGDRTVSPMFRLMRIVGLAVVLVGLGLGSGMFSSIAGESTPEMVTSDTLTYCRQLALQLDQLKSASSNPPQSVNDLYVAGKDMCESGSIRGGILRLRSAIVMLMHPGDTTLHAGRTE